MLVWEKWWRNNRFVAILSIFRKRCICLKSPSEAFPTVKSTAAEFPLGNIWEQKLDRQSEEFDCKRSILSPEIVRFSDWQWASAAMRRAAWGSAQRWGLPLPIRMAWRPLPVNPRGNFLHRHQKTRKHREGYKWPLLTKSFPDLIPLILASHTKRHTLVHCGPYSGN